MNLSSTEKRQLYRELCGQTYIPLHAKDWWLDAVCGIDNWEVALTFDGKGKISGALPYFLTKKLGVLTQIINPILSVYNNIYLDLPNNPDIKKTRLAAIEKKILIELISTIPSSTFFRQQLHPKMQNALPFNWAGYNQSTKYTHLLQDLSNLEKLFKNIQHNTRTNIKKAAKLTDIVKGNEVRTLFDLTRDSYLSKNIKIPYSLSLVEELFKTIQERTNYDLNYSIDKETGEAHSGLLTVYDEHTAYALIAGIKPKYKQSYSLNALYWQSIKNAAQVVNTYDFEGSMNPKIEHIFRNFGAMRTPYHCIYRFKNRAYHAAAVMAGLI